jgi:hypothetical protein
VKASYSFVLALLSCATTSALANSPASNNVRVASQTSKQVSTANSSLNSGNADAVAQGSSSAAFRLPAGTGSYNPHVKTRVNACEACSLTASSSLNIPANATEVTEIQALTDWQASQDSAGSGSASGTTGVVNTPSLSGGAREFQTSYSNSGDERYYNTFGADESATHFVYDGWVYIASPSNDVANLEMDTNQVMANGQTVIFGVQCDGYSETWDYTANEGTPENPSDVWLHSTATCNPRNWATNTWHHVQISYSRDDEGNATYESVWLDGAEQSMNVTVPSAFSLGWASALVTNFQVDGVGASGSATVYMDNLSVYRW